MILRVLEGDDVEMLPLARNAGTSLEMLERFYCRRLEAEQKIANLQSFKVQPQAELPIEAPSTVQKFIEGKPLLVD